MKKNILIGIIVSTYSLLSADSFNPQGTTINVIGDNGMYAGEGETAINEGTVANIGDYGMFSENDGITINRGIIANTRLIGMYSKNRGIAINESTGIISSNSSYGMLSYSKGSISINEGIVSNNGIGGMLASFGGIVKNRGIIKNNDRKGIYVECGLGINEEGAIISNTGSQGIFVSGGRSFAENNGIVENVGDYGFFAEFGGSVYNLKKGVIRNISSNQTGMQLTTVTEAKNEGIIIVNPGATNAIGVKAINSDFYNSGSIEAQNNTAIAMYDRDSLLELGAGTHLRGITDGLKGEDTLVLSGNGIIDVGNNSVHNFEKLVTTGDITAVGTYNLNVSNGSQYRNKSFSLTNKYDIDDVSGAPGILTVDGTINVAVDYDGIDANGTEKTGKIIANRIVKTNNGNIILVKGGNSSLNIVDEALNSNSNIDKFRVKGIATVNGAQVVDPDLFSLSSDMNTSTGWGSVTVGDRLGQNGSILIDQRYYKTVPTKKDTNSKLIIPRNRVDLDSMNKLTGMTNELITNNKLEEGDSRFSISYLGTKEGSRFSNDNSYNYDYDVKSNGVGLSYISKITPNITLGAGFSNEKNKVDYGKINLNNKKIVSQNNKENIETYNAQIFGKYEVNNFDIKVGVGYGISEHQVVTNFVSGLKNAKYDSKVLKTGIEVSYNYMIMEDLTLIPSMGIDYIQVKEDSYKYNNSSVKLEKVKADGYVGTIGLKLRKNIDSFRWSVGVGYKYNSRDSFHETRKVAGYPLEVEKLVYDKKTAFAQGGLEYDIYKNTTVGVNYKYERNKNFNNKNLQIELIYKF